MDLAPAPLPELPCRLREVWTAELPHAAGVVRFLLRGLVAGFGPLTSVEGAERLAGLPEPAIFALNHNSTFEALAAPAALLWLRRGRMIHFLIDWMYLHLPGIGWVMRQSDPIPVYGKPARWRLGEGHRRERLRRPVVEACLERLAAGGSLGIFPEGTRNRSADLLPGRPGLGEVVLRSTAPVVPVGLRFPAAERLGRPPRLGRIVLVIGEPLEFQAERAQAAGLSPHPRPLSHEWERGEQQKMPSLCSPLPLAGEGLGVRASRRSLARHVVAEVMSEIARLSGKGRLVAECERRAS